jgi:glycosyltransferase involved in cell wall biosynthesis
VRVLFLAHSYPRRAGDAAGSFLLRLAVGLRAAGVEVRVLAPAAAGLAPTDVIEGVSVRRVRYAPRAWETLAYTGTMAEAVQGSWRSRAALLGLLGSGAAAVAVEARRWPADVVHAHWWFPGALAAVAPGALGGRPLVLTMHGSDVRLAAKLAPARALFARVAQRASAVTAVSRWLCSQAVAMAPALHCEVAPMPVAVELFSPPVRDDARDGLLFVGRLSAQKGVDALLRAVADMHVATPLTIVGSGPEEPTLRALAETLGIAQRVRWMPAQPQTALPSLYASARALVIPSREEGLGLVAVEAHLCGTPVVAFASGGLPDVVRHLDDGLLVPAGDVGALAAALDALNADPARAARLGAAGRTTALASFAPAAAAERYRAIYERVRAHRA